MLNASLMAIHSLLNDSKCNESTLCSNHCPFKDSVNPNHSDAYSIAVKFNILSLAKFYSFSSGAVCRGKCHLQMTDSD